MSDPRPCEWCGGELRPGQKTTCRASCRGGRWRWLNDVRRAHGTPPEAPPWPESPLHGRMGENVRSNAPQAPAVPTPGPRSGVNARSGIMLSLRKTRATLVERLGHFPGAEALIDEALTDALAPTQRRKLDRERTTA